jgi:hypothetical protein
MMTLLRTLTLLATADKTGTLDELRVDPRVYPPSALAAGIEAVGDRLTITTHGELVSLHARGGEDARAAIGAFFNHLLIESVREQT